MSQVAFYIVIKIPPTAVTVRVVFRRFLCYLSWMKGPEFLSFKSYIFLHVYDAKYIQKCLASASCK